MTIKMVDSTLNGKPVVSVSTPYYPAWTAEIRPLNGKWSGSQWHFDPRDRAAVESSLIKHFGTTGADHPELVDIQIELTETEQEAYGYGRQLARRPGRDHAVQLGQGVIVVAGAFPGSCGSSKYPMLQNRGGSVVIEVRDVPRCLVGDRATIVREHDIPAPAANPFADFSVEQLHELIAAATAELERRQQVPG